MAGRRRFTANRSFGWEEVPMTVAEATCGEAIRISFETIFIPLKILA